ncbi:hypothetical protein C0J52_09940 [Blattella germanica]|nr:hypothetical protein C0J52_09940 [Blattella germanica]
MDAFHWPIYVTLIISCIVFHSKQLGRFFTLEMVFPGCHQHPEGPPSSSLFQLSTFIDLISLSK